MMRRLRRLALALALTLPAGIVLTGCPATTSTTPVPPKTPLQRVSIGLLDTAQTVASLQSAIIQANEQKLITDQTTRAILQVCVRINQAGLEANSIVKALSTLNTTNKSQLLAIITPVLAAVNDSLATGLIPITNPNTATTVRGFLTTIQIALSGIQIALN